MVVEKTQCSSVWLVVAVGGGCPPLLSTQRVEQYWTRWIWILYSLRVSTSLSASSQWRSVSLSCLPWLVVIVVHISSSAKYKVYYLQDSVTDRKLVKDKLSVWELRAIEKRGQINKWESNLIVFIAYLWVYDSNTDSDYVRLLWSLIAIQSSECSPTKRVAKIKAVVASFLSSCYKYLHILWLWA